MTCPKCGFTHHYARETCPRCGASDAYEEYPPSRRTRIAVGCFVFALGFSGARSILFGEPGETALSVLTGIIVGSLCAFGFDKFLCGPSARKRKRP